MDSKGFVRIVNEAFVPFLDRHGLVMEELDLSGRLYEASFTTRDLAVSVSYEPGDAALFIMVFRVEGGDLSSIDDRSQTPRLADLNNRYLRGVTAQERLANE